MVSIGKKGRFRPFLAILLWTLCWTFVLSGTSTCDCDGQGEPWGFTGGCEACTCPSKNDNGTYAGVAANNCSATSDCDACVCCATDTSGSPPDLTPGVIYLGYCAPGFHLEVQGCECVCAFDGYSGWEVAFIVLFSIGMVVILGICVFSVCKKRNGNGTGFNGRNAFPVNICPLFGRKRGATSTAAAYIADGPAVSMAAIPNETPPRASTDEYENVDLDVPDVQGTPEDLPKSAREQKRNPWRSMD